MTTLRRTAELAARRAIANRTEAALRATGALRDAHVVLPDGRHGGASLATARLLADPAATGEVAAFLAGGQRPEGGSPAVDAVLGVGGGGAVVLAFEIARQLGVRAGVVAAPGEDLAYGPVPSGARVLLVDLELAADGRLLAAIPAVEAAGAELVACGVVVDRTNGGAHVTSAATRASYPLTALLRFDPASVEPGPATCPRCAAGEPLMESR